MRQEQPEDPVTALRRWEAFGGTWQVAARSPDVVAVSLLRCDGGEEVSRIVSGDPALLAYVDRQLGARGEAGSR
jgi:hypothetical protein